MVHFLQPTNEPGMKEEILINNRQYGFISNEGHLVRTPAQGIIPSPDDASKIDKEVREQARAIAAA